MRRRYKSQYFVQDDGDYPYIWWIDGKWQKGMDNLKNNGSNMKRCRNLKNAIKSAEKILSLGGTPLISKRYWYKGTLYWKDYDYK